jgi:hypothetical protein
MSGSVKIYHQNPRVSFIEASTKTFAGEYSAVAKLTEKTVKALQGCSVTNPALERVKKTAETVRSFSVFVELPQYTVETAKQIGSCLDADRVTKLKAASLMTRVCETVALGIWSVCFAVGQIFGQGVDLKTPLNVAEHLHAANTTMKLVDDVVSMREQADYVNSLGGRASQNLHEGLRQNTIYRILTIVKNVFALLAFIAATFLLYTGVALVPVAVAASFGALNAVSHLLATHYKHRMDYGLKLEAASS